MKTLKYLKGPTNSDLKHSNAFKLASRRRTWSIGWSIFAALAALLALALRPIFANVHALEKDHAQSRSTR